jgi:hypothetical protein
MLKNLFTRRDSAPTLMQSPHVASNAPAASEAPEFATLGPMAIPQAGPAATRYVSAPSSLSPVVRAAAERITGHPVA